MPNFVNTAMDLGTAFSRRNREQLLKKTQHYERVNMSLLQCLDSNYLLLPIFRVYSTIPIILCPCLGCDECSLSLRYVQEVLCTCCIRGRRLQHKHSFSNERLIITACATHSLRLSVVRDCRVQKYPFANRKIQAPMAFHLHPWPSVCTVLLIAVFDFIYRYF